MKRMFSIALLLTFVLSLLMPLAVMAQTGNKAATGNKPKTQNQFEMYQVVIVKKGPNWKSQNTTEGMDIRMQVIENVKKAAAEGLVVSAGLVNDETDAEFIIIFHIETKVEALKMLEASPNYRNGFYGADVYSWFAPKGLTVN